MRVPVSWLREFVAVDLSAEEIARVLTDMGLEVETVHRPGAEMSGLVVGRIVEVSPHPDASRLTVCRVDVGDPAGPVQIVTGAPNAAPGVMAVAAVPGARLYDGTAVKAMPLRGVHSAGMLCATWELGLPSDARTDEERLEEGIIILPAEEGLTPGADAKPLLGLDEEVLELELTPNYAVHCQSILGIARELGAALGLPVGLPRLPGAAGGSGEGERAPAGSGGSGGSGGGPGGTGWDHATDYIGVAIEDPDLCGHYTARVILDARVAPSPLWIQRRLQLCGMRPINNLVDATNYVLLETGQPLHAFDLDRLAGARLSARRARAGEDFTGLDGGEYELAAGDLVIADEDGPQALAGIMGGWASQVGSGTTSVALESARFHPAAVMAASRRLGLRTDASARFDKGTDPLAVRSASLRAAELMAALSGGRVVPGAAEEEARPAETRTIIMRPHRVRRIIVPDEVPAGVEVPDLSDGAIASALERLGFEVADAREGDGRAGELAVTVPSYRGDVHGEADLAEEVGRLMGYGGIPALLPRGAVRADGRPRTEEKILRLRRSMAAAGFTEVVTLSFAQPRWPSMVPPGEERKPVELANPMSGSQARLRTSLVPGMLEVLSHNFHHGMRDAAVFEVSAIYYEREDARPPRLPDGSRPGRALPAETVKLGVAARGRPAGGHWQGETPAMDFFGVKGALEYGVKTFGTALAAAPAVMPFLHPGRSALLTEAEGGGALGWLGELHPELADEFDLPAGIIIGEINVDRLLAGAETPVRYEPVPRHPSVERDVAFIIDKKVAAAEAVALIEEAAGPLLAGLTLFDVYEGHPVPEGCRSLAFNLEYRASGRTLTDEEVDQAHGQVRRRLAEDLKADLR